MAPCLARSPVPSQLGLQGRAISSLLTGVSQLRTWILRMSTDAAARSAIEVEDIQIKGAHKPRFEPTSTAE
jgi:hypothetical protein